MTDAPDDRTRLDAAEHPYGGVEPRYSPEELAELLGGNLPTAQQSAVISTPLATSQTTRSTMVAVLPEPAPATTSRGVSGAEITADCWAVGRLPPSSSASSSGLYRGSTPP